MRNSVCVLFLRNQKHPLDQEVEVTPSVGAHLEVTPSVDATKISVATFAIAVWLDVSADEHAHYTSGPDASDMVSIWHFTRETICRRRWIWFGV